MTTNDVQLSPRGGFDAVLFDLYGTLVAPFRRREHTVALRACADILGVDVDVCHTAWVASFPRRISGEFSSVADNFRWICREAGREASPESAAAAQERYLEFTREGLRPVPGALELLDWLRTRGTPVGLVSNCAPDVPLVWPESALAPYFKYCAFSCQVGAVKPAREIYEDALRALAVEPERVLYIGDGSDQELPGAAACGMRPVLVRIDLSNTYDSVRPGLETWAGDTVTDLTDAVALF
ncbi:HAD family hydrolase [Micromonospora sediminicola]|uniref:HAD family hydrolase n=1 Tax=Micromonospora sediminicola TaxID=946078 RepID=UPI0037A9BA28